LICRSPANKHRNTPRQIDVEILVFLHPSPGVVDGGVGVFRIDLALHGKQQWGYI
jgi:hypothetical protein